MIREGTCISHWIDPDQLLIDASINRCQLDSLWKSQKLSWPFWIIVIFTEQLTSQRYVHNLVLLKKIDFLISSQILPFNIPRLLLNTRLGTSFYSMWYNYSLYRMVFQIFFITHSVPMHYCRVHMKEVHKVLINPGYIY